MPFLQSGICKNGCVSVHAALMSRLIQICWAAYLMALFSETVNGLRFSHDGEWIATVVAKQKEVTFVSSSQLV
jgi:hypothetical protein